MKDRFISLVVFCCLGLAACIASYKYGPIRIQKQMEAPPGWTPPQAAPPVAPVAPVNPQPAPTTPNNS
jgi:hypothetical protein